MEIKVSTENGRVPVTVLHVTGNVDAMSHDKFLTSAREVIQGGARHILLDLTQTSFISSAGLRAVNLIFNELRSLHPDSNLSDDDVKKGIADGTYKSPHLKLFNPSNDIQTLLKTTGFDLFIEIYSDMKAAIAAF